ncbi:MAG: hypothetical protein HYX50_00230 [Chloroflexi bacterium]|nr:hypothetical protein [Chloroflexota bacterium]
MQRWSRFLAAIDAHPRLALLALAVAALGMRLALLPAHAYLVGGGTDEEFWIRWMRASHEDGVLNVLRTPRINYVGYQWVLWALSGVYALLGGSYDQPTAALGVLIKLPALVGDAALITLVWHVTGALVRGRPSGWRRAALCGAALIAFQPAILYDGALWSQIDSVVAAAMLGAVVLATRGRPGAAWAVWAIGVAVKPQPVLILPVLLPLTVRVSGGAGMLRGLGSASLVIAAVLGPWIVHGDGIAVTRAYGAMLGDNYGRLSVSAWNPWWVVDRFVAAEPGDAPIPVAPLMTYRLIGSALALAAATLALAYAWARPTLRGALIAGGYLGLAFYMLPVSSHERYGYPALVMLAPIAIVDRRWALVLLALGTSLFANMFVIAPPVPAWAARWDKGAIAWAGAAVNLAVFFGYSAIMAQGARDTLPDVRQYLRGSFPFNRMVQRAPRLST